MNYVVAENKYGKYAIPNVCLNDSVSKPILAGGVHEKHTIEFILNNRGSGAVIHAGAYFGDFLPALSGPDNIVYSFEPSKIFYECAKLTLELTFPDGKHKTSLYNYALSSEKSTQKLLSLRTEDESEGGASRIMTNAGGVPPWRLETVETVTLDSIIPNNQPVSLIHLDVEGFEEKALMGAMQIIQNHRPLILIEMADDRTLETEFYQEFMLNQMDYEIDRSVFPRDAMFRPRK